MKIRRIKVMERHGWVSGSKWSGEVILIFKNDQTIAKLLFSQLITLDLTTSLYISTLKERGIIISWFQRASHVTAVDVQIINNYTYTHWLSLQTNDRTTVQWNTLFNVLISCFTFPGSDKKVIIIHFKQNQEKIKNKVIWRSYLLHIV